MESVMKKMRQQFPKWKLNDSIEEIGVRNGKMTTSGKIFQQQWEMRQSHIVSLNMNLYNFIRLRSILFLLSYSLAKIRIQNACFLTESNPLRILFFLALPYLVKKKKKNFQPTKSINLKSSHRSRNFYFMYLVPKFQKFVLSSEKTKNHNNDLRLITFFQMRFFQI